MDKPITLSPSVAKILVDADKTPYHAFMSHYALGGTWDNSSTEAQTRGKVVDALLFGVGATIVVRKPRERLAAGPGEIVLLQSELDEATEIANSAKAAWRERFDVSPLPGFAQQRLAWTADGGILCSGRPDYFDPVTGVIVDLKTCRSISDRGIKYAIRDYGWDIQAAAYLEGASGKTVDGVAPSVAFLAVEASSPYCTRWVTWSALAMGEATAKWRRACAVWKDCLASESWPAYGDLEITVDDEITGMFATNTKGTK